MSDLKLIDRGGTMNIPNLLTTLRFILIPAFIYFFYSNMAYGIETAIAIFLLSGITDTLDGYIARRYNQITKLGIVLDPLADKLMLITVLVSISISNDIPIWIVGIVIVKEMLMIIGAFWLMNKRDAVIPANRLGKVTTLLFYIAILAVLFELPFNRVILFGYLAATVAALFIYMNRFISVKKQQISTAEKSQVIEK
jgi:cardiolipin synthase